jgi:hypothetical protein
MIVTPVPADLAMVIELLPDDCGEYGWDVAKALERWSGSVYRTVREFWVDRTNDTAGYIDLTDDGLPALQLHTSAKDMLEYWDQMIATSEAAELVAANSASGTHSRRIVRG